MRPDSFGLVREHSNVVVLRTFSKAYGLAGLRVGYAVGDPDIMTALGKVYVPFSHEHLAGRCHRVARRRRRAVGPHRRSRRRTGPGHRALREAGFTVPPSQANFVWLPLAERTLDFVNAPPTTACWSGRTARTACGSPSPPRRRTTPSSSSPNAGSERNERRAGP